MATELRLQNPFPGLRPYRECEAENFHGQDEQIEGLLERLGASRFVAVAGVSGCGKSSLVRAGLVAALRQTSSGERPRWFVANCRPGADPIANLAAAVTETLGARTSVLPALRRCARGIVNVAGAAGIAPDQRVLVVVDQFEELFRYRRIDASLKREDNAAQFVRLLLEAAEDPNANIYVVITMRSDFLGDCALFYGLAERINEGLYLVPKMQRRQLREVIEEPIRSHGGSIRPILTERLLNESEEREDGLPLLQHALMRIWNHWTARGASGPIDEQDFDLARPGSARPLIEWHLDEHLGAVYSSLTASRQDCARRLFQLLSERDPSGREIRRGVPLEDISRILKVGSAELLEIIDAFRDEAAGRTFLVPPKGEGGAADPIDISHECLLRQWSLLRRWMQEEARDAAQFRRIADAAEAAGPGEFLAGTALASLSEWWHSFSPSPEWAQRYEITAEPGAGIHQRSYEAAKKFLEASEAERLRLEEEAEMEARRQAEMRAAEERARTKIRVLAAACAVFVVIAVFAGLAVWQMRDAQREAARAALAQKQAEQAQSQEATAKREAEEADTRARAAQTAYLKDRKAVLAPPPSDPVPRIYTQVWNPDQAAQLKPVLDQLRRGGFKVPAVEQVAVGPAGTELRFFRFSDRTTAEKIAGILSSAGTQATPTYVPGFEKGGAAMRPNHFELWLGRPGQPATRRAQVVVLFLDNSRKAEAVEIGRILNSYSPDVIPYNPRSVIWKFESPIELHYFHREDEKDAAGIIGVLAQARISVRPKFTPVKEKISPKYFEIWLQGR